MLAEEAMRKVKIARQSSPLDLRGLNSGAVSTKGQVVLDVWHRTEERKIATTMFVILDVLNWVMPHETFSHFAFDHISTANLADPHYHRSGPICGIIGVSFLAEQTKFGIERNAIGLTAQSTSMGWTISGGSDPEEEAITTDALSLITIKDLHAQIHKLWEIEETPERTLLSADEQACEALYQSTLVREPNRYAVSLLLRPDERLGESREMAGKRFAALENRFKKSPELKETYI